MGSWINWPGVATTMKISLIFHSFEHTLLEEEKNDEQHTSDMFYSSYGDHARRLKGRE